MWVGSSVIVGHNVNYDIRVLEQSISFLRGITSKTFTSAPGVEGGVSLLQPPVITIKAYCTVVCELLTIVHVSEVVPPGVSSGGW